MTAPLIVISNDDGIDSPGLVALATALDPLGDLLIAAPQFQQSGAGRNMLADHSGRIIKTEIGSDEKKWPAYAVDASPALTVQHAIFELAERAPSIVVSGINYGENIGVASGTISGTVGAALEGASKGIPAIAISLQVPPELYLTHDDSVDFSVAGHFAWVFTQKLLRVERPPDVDVLKLEIPANATPETPWRVTRLETASYYEVVAPKRENGLNGEGKMGYRINRERISDPETDAGALAEGIVAVTPLSLNMTSRVKLQTLDDLLQG